MRLLLACLLLLAPDALAQATSGSSGMALTLVCQTYTILSGNLGLMLGFIVAAYGLFILIFQANYRIGIIIIVAGALLTALPGLVMGGLKGVNNLLIETGVTESSYNISTLIDNVVAKKGQCGQINVDLSNYDKLGDMEGGVDPESGIRARGTGSFNVDDGGDIPEMDSSMVGQKPCVGKVMDIAKASTYRISSPFGSRTNPYTGVKGSFHAGIDIAAPAGTPILAYSGGMVSTAARSASAGNWVVIDHGNGLISKYMHMVRFPSVRAGQQVAAGTVLGYVGSTGNSTGNHLHFQVEQNGTKIDPAGPLGCGA